MHCVCIPCVISTKAGFNSGIDLELDLILSLIPGIEMGIKFQGIPLELNWS